MKTQSEALIWRFGVKNICKRLVFSSSVVLTSFRKSPSNSFFASSSCKIVSIRNNSKVSLGSRSCSTWQLFAAAGVPPPASLSPTTSWETQEPIFKNHIGCLILLILRHLQHKRTGRTDAAAIKARICHDGRKAVTCGSRTMSILVI